MLYTKYYSITYRLFLVIRYNRVVRCCKMSVENYLTLFRNRLIKLQAENNISSRALSTGIGASENYIHGVISGNTNPSLTKIFEICEFLDIPPRLLFDFDTPKEKQLSHCQEAAARLNGDELDYFIDLMDGFLLLKESRKKDGR